MLLRFPSIIEESCASLSDFQLRQVYCNNENFNFRQVGGNAHIIRLLQDTRTFNSCQVHFRKSFLDMLYLVLRKDVYDVIKFQSFCGIEEKINLFKILMDMLEDSIKKNQPLTVSKRIVHIIGLVGAAGITSSDLKQFLRLLRSPTPLSISLLQALKIMIRQETGVVKAFPSSFFNFGGHGAGLVSEATSSPFTKEFQLSTWFRIEEFNEESEHNFTQHILCWNNSTQKGMDVYVEKKVLVVAVYNNAKHAEPTHIRLSNNVLRRGVWYHLSVKHAKPRMTLFGNDEMTVCLDHQVVFQEAIRFPSLGSLPDAEFIIGQNFNGQMTPVYFFAESLPLPVIEQMARIDAGKSIDGVESSFNPTYTDLLTTIVTSDRKVNPVLAKVTMSYHPLRCLHGKALDIHSGRHANLCMYTQPWSIVNVRDLLVSIGGISCLMPLFPKLLIESESEPANEAQIVAGGTSPASYSPMRSSTKFFDSPGAASNSSVVWNGVGGLGTSISALNDEYVNGDSPLDYSVNGILKTEKEEFAGDGCIGLLLSILAKCITLHPVYQQELVASGGIEMIEYSLTCVPQEILQAEGERCVLSLIQLKSAATGNAALELKITKCLLCNIAIWSRASFLLVSSLMSVILAAIRAQPHMFIDLLGVKNILDALELFYPSHGILALEQDGTDSRDEDLAKLESVSSEVGGAVEAVNLANLSATMDALEADSLPPLPKVPSVHQQLGAEGESPTKQRRKSKRVSAVSFASVDMDSSTTRGSLTPGGIQEVKTFSRNIKRMKSFKLALTETMEDTVNEETNQLEVLAEIDESAAQDFTIRESTEDATGLESPGALSNNSEQADAVNSVIVSESAVSLQLDMDLVKQPSTETVSTLVDEAQQDVTPVADQRDDESSVIEDVYVSPQTNEQKKHLRDCLNAMLVILLQQRASEKEMGPLLEFLLICKDRTVLNEISQALLYLMVEGGGRIIQSIITCCSGPEEFASLVLLYVAHQPNEELRCTGVRLLTHFYLRVESMPPSIMNLTLRRRKGFLARALANISTVSDQGLYRLQVCGGLALLCEIVRCHSKISSELTYSALLELLLTKPSTKAQVTVQYSDLFEQTSIGAGMGVPLSSPPSGGSSAQGRSRHGSVSYGHGKVGQRTVVFAAHYLSPDQVHDEGVDMTNGVILPIFFELLPQLPTAVQGQIYSDLLALLKHSIGNREAFIACPSWHLCMFGLVSQLVSKIQLEQESDVKLVNSYEIVATLEKISGIAGIDSFNAEKLRMQKKQTSMKKDANGELLRAWNSNSSSTPQFTYKDMSTVNSAALSSPQVSSEFDLWFALGMKIYATLLLHAIDYKGGWKEIDRCISASHESELGYSVAQTVLSHVLNELTFTMRSRYKELQKLAKSTSIGDNHEASDKLENTLSIIVTASQLCLLDQHCVTSGIKNFNVCKLRVHYFNEFGRDFIAKKAQQMGIDSNTADYNNLNITQLEVRNLMDRTEDKLRTKLRLSPPPTPTSSAPLEAPADPGDKALEYDQCLDFFHSWIDLAAKAEGPFRFDNLKTQLSAASSGAGNSTPTKSTEELLHPLERNHDLMMGKLVLVLQTLRFFDGFFWPSDTNPIRNVEMLRFNKEYSSLSMNSSDKTSSETKRKEGGQTHQLTLFSSTMRMCVFVLNKLSPLTHLAVHNIKRIHVLLSAIDKVTQYNTPTHDWLLAMLLHVTLNIQRIAVSLESIYDIIGIDDKVAIPTIGPWDDSYDSIQKLSEREMRRFEFAASSPDMLRKIQNYFDSSPGRTLIRNIRTSLNILVDVFETHNSKLATTLEERSFRALWVLVENIKADLQSKIIANANNHADVGLVEPGRLLNRAQSKSRFDSTSVDTATGDIFDPASNSSLGPKKRSNSEISETSSAAGSGSDERNVNSALFPVEYIEESFLGSDILLVLKWLRFPYFKTNIFRSVGLIKAIDALDYLEARSVGKFLQDLHVLKDNLAEQRDIAIKSIEEMTELKELSIAVHNMLLTKHNNRVTVTKLNDNLKLKSVAERWQTCIERFEADWSPWRTEGDSSAIVPSKPGMALYEISKHRDNGLRKMLLTKLPEPVDHSGAAYFEGKQRDQQNYEAGIMPTRGGPSTEALKNDLPRVNLPFKPTMLSKQGTVSNRVTNTWGDEEENDGSGSPSDVLIDDENTKSTTGIAILDNLFQGSEKRPQWTRSFQWAIDERSLFLSEVTEINLDQVISGMLLLTNRCLYFHAKKRVSGLATSLKPIVDRRWQLDRLVEAYSRRYLLQNCAIELFFLDAPELFLAFKSLSTLKKFFRILRRQSTPLLTTPRSLNPKYVFSNSPWTELWRKRQISNFEYLMRLNIIAGRSYNDITQYPVFPWIIADYASNKLDFQRRDTFRQLDKPMGALNHVRLQEFLERYKTFDDDTIPKFMYGSHYSTAGVVIHYMIRQEPFTTLAINLQGGRFDCPDRVFFDVRRTWDGCNQSMSDVKELIPEMYSNPEILVNTNRLPLGELQEGGKVDNVILPPWAGNAYDFIRLNREALESDYVSEHLHEWIDLVFGYKQTGQAAVSAFNVFYYLTYENAVNIEAIEDPLQREAAKAQVTHFGQTPSQLLSREHPRRYAREECSVPLCNDAAGIEGLSVFTPARQFYTGGGAGGAAIISIRCTGERLVVVHSNMTVSYYRWYAFPDGEGNPFTIRFEKNKLVPSANLSASEEILKGRSRIWNIGDTCSATAEEEAVISGLPRRKKSVAFNEESVSVGNLKSPGSETSSSQNVSRSPSLSMLGSFRQSFRSLNIFDFGSGGSGGNATEILKPISSNSENNSGKYAMSTGGDSPTKTLIKTMTSRNNSTSAISFLTSNHALISVGDTGQARIVTCGYWDDALKIHAMDSLKEIFSSNNGHLGSITCIHQGLGDDHTVISGGMDGTLRVWILEKPSLASNTESYFGEFDNDGVLGADGIPSVVSVGGAPAVPLVCTRVLNGHHSPIKCINHSDPLDVVVSGSASGLICLHALRRGEYLRSIDHLLGASVDVVLASSPGYIVAHSCTSSSMTLFWVNGELLASVDLPYRVTCMTTGSNGNILICGTANGVLSFREIWSLEEIYFVDLQRGAISCLWFTEDYQYLFVGSEEGMLSIVTDSDIRLKVITAAISKTSSLGSV